MREVFYIFLSAVLMCFCLEILVQPLLLKLKPSQQRNLKTLLPQVKSTDVTKHIATPCPDIMKNIMIGKWKKRALSSKEEREIEIFLRQHNERTTSLKSKQRKDNKCGNISDEQNIYARALCDPMGPTPCCFYGTCVNKNSDECKCQECFDLRSRVHSEYSTWQPIDSRCKWKNFTSAEACRLLHDTKIHMVGDSLIRHFYLGLLLLLSNNVNDGGYVSTMPKSK